MQDSLYIFDGLGHRIPLFGLMSNTTSKKMGGDILECMRLLPNSFSIKYEKEKVVAIRPSTKMNGDLNAHNAF